MILKSFHIQNFRSVRDESLFCDDLTALVGPNGCGKSSFLKALEMFYAPSPKVERDDFYSSDQRLEISLSATYAQLSKTAHELFSRYVQGNELVVTKVIRFDEDRLSIKYHGSTLLNSDFSVVRQAFEVKDRGKSAKEAYSKLLESPEYSTLPIWTNAASAQAGLAEWEIKFPDKCSRLRDDGQFFGFKEVGQGYLGRFTKFLFIPAIRNVSEDSSEGKGSVFTDLMDLVVRSVLASRESIAKLKEETQRNYESIMSPERLSELKELSGKLTGTLKSFIPDAGIELGWLPLQNIEIPMPKADIKVIEDGFKTSVSRTGHGLQRAFVLTMLQHLTLAQSLAGLKDDDPEDEKKRIPNLILAIEEPELFQHPNRQRHIANIFLQLAKGKTPGVAEKTQIIYCTHSPFFVGIERINQIRVLKKIGSEEDKPKATKIVQTSLAAIADIVWRASGSQGDPFTAESIYPRLQSLMTTWMNEGFFADIIVLVEGEDDRAALHGAARHLGFDFETNGFSIIPCGGKNSIDRPAAIFSSLGIPLFIVWDGDHGGEKPKPEDNHKLLRLLNEPVVDWPDKITKRFACFKKDLEETLRLELGPEFFDSALEECQARYSIPKKKHALKNPAVVADIIEKAHTNGLKSQSLITMTTNIIRLKFPDFC